MKFKNLFKKLNNFKKALLYKKILIKHWKILNKNNKKIIKMINQSLILIRVN